MKIAQMFGCLTEKSKLYYRNLNYLRSLALTEAALQLEREGAIIVGGSIALLQNRDVETDTFVSSFKSYFACVIDGLRYYVQYVDNYFMEDHVSLSYQARIKSSCGECGISKEQKCMKTTYVDDGYFNMLSVYDKSMTERQAIDAMANHVIKTMKEFFPSKFYKTNDPSLKEAVVYVEGVRDSIKLENPLVKELVEFE